MNKSLLVKLLLLVSSPVLAEGAQPILPEQQLGIISYETDEDKKIDDERSKMWADFCLKFSKHLQITASLPGFLKTATCLGLDGKELEATKALSKKKKKAKAAPALAQEAQVSTPVPAKSGETPFWQIRVFEHKRLFDIKVSILNGKEGYRLLREFSFKMEKDLLGNLKGEIVPAAMARLVVEGLPTGWSFVYDASQSQIKFAAPKDLPGLPPELLVYDLAYDAPTNQWQPTVRARLRRVEQNTESKKRLDVYSVAQIYRPLQDKKVYWLQNVSGLNKRQSEYEAVLGKSMEGLSLLNFLDRLIFDSLTSNYAGFRYGRSFLSGSSIVTETDILSVLVEMRSGIFDGLRFYYDRSPEKRKGSGETAEYFKMSRGSLGWAFDYDLPSFFQPIISKVEVQPKFGLLDLSTKFSVENEFGEKQSLDFDARNVYDLALELGVEKESYWFRTRLWGSFNAAKFGVSNKSNVSVLSSKAGIDTYFDLINWGKWDVNVLAFAVAERLNLSKSGNQIAADAEIGISDVSFNLFFLGGGFTISW